VKQALQEKEGITVEQVFVPVRTRSLAGSTRDLRMMIKGVVKSGV